MNLIEKNTKFDVAVLRYGVYESLPGVKMVNRVKWKLNVRDILRYLTQNLNDDGILVVEVEDVDLGDIRRSVSTLGLGANEIGIHLVSCTYSPYLFWMVFSKAPISDLPRLDVSSRTRGTKNAFAGYFKERIDVPHLLKLDPSTLSTKEQLMYRIFSTLKREEVIVAEFFGDSDEMSQIAASYNKHFDTKLNVQHYDGIEHCL